MDILVKPQRLARRCERLKPSTIREMLKVTQNPDVISFGGGLPAAELFPVAEISAAQDRVMRTRGASALQYSVTDGVTELREWVAARMRAQHGVAVDADDVVITGGSQQGLDLYGRVFLDAGDIVALENPSYLGAIQAFDAFEPAYLPAESDENGIVPAALERAFANADPLPKFLYLVANYENPTGRTLAAERRPEIVAICARYGVPILEDDPYGEIAFEQHAPPALLSHAANGAVTYLGTGSKMVAPGLRVAWMVIPDRTLREKIVTAKQGADLHSSTYAQYVFHAYVEDEARLRGHLNTVRATYRARRDAMVAALAAQMPAHVRWNVPGGGMFLWVTVGAGIDTEELFEHAVRDGVVFVPGRPFYPHRDRGDGMRLNFSAMPEPRIDEGIARLATAIRHLGG
ncbi:2-aminoadipate aminotransferase [Vulcanimicrobium alpinum]|uniref:2-aminoadipate aminotransferase n=1 Tax=Vulcanimicrobium alpinum TaxID=3016050 RepID=A0AAN1XYD9_UNVUL|nr:PLP-dependent aminotransferase family protein [Vulcanimicrobium alpinum]BDE07653.1 2-aminoadipate aminotransferase [Vulcanimicrobium alpinum]